MHENKNIEGAEDGDIHSKAAAQFTPVLYQALPGLVSALVLAVCLPEKYSGAVIVPFYVMNTFFCKTTIPLGILVSTVYVFWLSPFYGALKFLTGFSWNCFWLLFYLHLVVILARYGYDSHSILGKFTVRVLFEPPLLITMRIVHFFGGRFFQPFFSVIDDDLIVGSMPFESDVKFLAEELKVAAVVNMCQEYSGPVQGYKKHGIEQLRLPTYDTSAPSYDHLEVGISFISKFLLQKKKEGNTSRKVFIHCKGGVGRAATMALAFLISKGMTPQTGFHLLKKRRKVVSHSILEFHVTQLLFEKYGNTTAVYR